MPFMHPISWFRTRNALPHELSQQTGHSKPDLDRHVIESRESDDADFTAVNVRPLTYAEASEQSLPAVNRRIVSAEPYTSIDESKLAIQAVEEYISQCEKSEKKGASLHVTANIDLDTKNGDIVSGKRHRHRRERRRSSNAKSAAQQEHRENSRLRDKSKSQNTVSAIE